MFYFVVTQYKFLAHANLEALLKSAERTETTGVHINAAITIKQTFHLKKKQKQVTMSAEEFPYVQTQR